MTFLRPAPRSFSWPRAAAITAGELAVVASARQATHSAAGPSARSSTSSFASASVARPSAASSGLRERLLRSTARRLRSLAAVLLRQARALTPPARLSRPLEDLPRFEFHAEAGAPEGALYVDGVLVGHLEVTRL